MTSPHVKMEEGTLTKKKKKKTITTTELPTKNIS
jgi:hypothetical protein